MKRSLIGVAAVLLPFFLFSCQKGGDSAPVERALVNRLLQSIDSAGVYRARKEAVLEEKKCRLAEADPSSREWLTLCNAVAREYGNYIADSSIAYSDMAISRALALNQKDLYLDAILNKMVIFNRTGYFVASSSILENLKLSDFPESMRWRYYAAHADYYHSLYTATPSSSGYRSQFTEKYSQYRDTLISLLPPDSDIVLRENEKIAGREGRIDDALRINSTRMERLQEGEMLSRALVLYDRHSIYRFYMKRPVSDHVQYILESAIIDIESANQNIASMRYVESYLISKKDISSAKTVSDYYYSAMRRFGSRTRLLDALDISMRINNDYARMLSRQKHKTQASLSVIVLMLLVTLLVLRKALSSRHHIEKLNQDLERSSKTALSYVLGFFNLYSSYIERFLSIRSKINVNMRRGNYDYVLSLTDPSKDITSDELKSMLSYFDSAFLDICPDYVQKFNAMLRPECRIILKSDEKLNMELRIFAIIKLGITDSSKISELLHCSIKTVYNKRSEINTKLSLSKEEFLKRLQEM